MKKYIAFLFIILSFSLISRNILAAKTNYITILTFGEYGNREGEFNYPVGITQDNSGNLYITDWENDRIQIFSSEGRLLKVIPEKDSELKIDGPVGIVLDQNENIVVVEQFNNRIQKISPDGKSLNMVGKEGNGPGEFLNPRGIAIDKNDNIYVVDTGNNRVQIFSSDFKFKKQFGREGMGDGEFYYPRGIALDKEGNIYVADTFHNRVQVFNNEGRFLRKFGEGGDDVGQFNGTRYIAFDSKGNIYVTDYKNGKVVKFNKEEQFELEFGNDPDDVKLSFPEGIAIDNRDYIFVVYAGNNRIVKFCLSKIVIHNNLGKKYLDEHKWGEAISEFKQVISIDPLNITAREGIALAFYENGEWENAIKAYNYLKENDPDNPQIKIKIIDSQFNLAMHYENRSSFKEACREYKEVLNLNPNYPSAKKRYYISYLKYLFYSPYFRVLFLALIVIIFFIILLPKIKKKKKKKKISRHSKGSRY